MSSNFYDEVEIEDMDFDEIKRIYYFPCPCGDKFQISEDDLFDGEEIARCPSCSLIIRVIYDADDFQRDESEDEGESRTGGTETVELDQTVEVK
ncbi:Diphthamide biosynthesis protein 3 [Gonapodya sp. JEL0774]|nr:Diphthamide biosynthesis protein 3 [Gonapodya sp. JEL0774]